MGFVRIILVALFLSSTWARAEPRRRARAALEPAPTEAAAKPADKPPADAPEPPVKDGAPPGETDFLGCHKYPENKRFKWTIRGEVGLPELVASLADMSCLSIVVSSALATRTGKVTLEVPDLITTTEVYRLFYSALESLGLTVERSGRTLKIVDAGRAKEISTPQLDGQAPLGDQFVTRLYRVQHASVQELAELIGKLRSKEGEVTAYAAGNAIILTDRGNNIRRMEEMARALDVAQPGQRIFLVATHAQSPTELGTTVEKILQAARRPGGADPKAASAGLGEGVAAIVPVDGARVVAVVATDAGYHRVAQLLARLDPPLSDDDGHETQTHVIYLANTNAEDMANTLKEVGLSSRPVTTGRPGAIGAPSPTGLPLQGDVRIGTDKISNALVVFANGPDFAMVRDLVNKLDLPRRQVYVEATILDVSTDKARQLGVAFHSGQDLGGGTTGFAVSGTSTVNSATVTASTLASALGTGGLVAGVLGQSINFGGASIPSFGVMLQALEHSQDVNVLSKPHILTMDNIKAAIAVGQSFPVQTSGANGINSGTLLATYGRQEVLLTLELTPHLNDSDSVRLELSGEISDVPDGATSGPGGPVTNKRTIKTAIVVRDGETIVLGGLQKEKEVETVDKIPGLGDIPLIGRLFQMRGKQHQKQDLLIVLTPYVIRGPEDLRRIYEQRECERREFVERYTAFRDESAYEAHADYRRKRGLLEEINVLAKNAAEQARAAAAAKDSLKRAAVVEGPIE
jgi:general secretion pathway protein D